VGVAESSGAHNTDTENDMSRILDNRSAFENMKTGDVVRLAWRCFGHPESFTGVVVKRSENDVHLDDGSVLHDFGRFQSFGRFLGGQPLWTPQTIQIVK